MNNIKNLHAAMIIITDKEGNRHRIDPNKSEDIDVEISKGHPFLKAGWIEVKPGKKAKPDESPEDQALDIEALKTEFTELFGKGPGNMKAETIKAKIDEERKRFADENE